MKILFVCGGLESGKDGVGDYTRRFCAELMRKDIEVGMLALYDSYTDFVDETSQEMYGLSIPTLRLPLHLTKQERCNIAKNWIDSNNPEWLSLQFVPYSFNIRGLPFGLGSQLKKISGTRKWHVMFHELWLGLRQNDSIKFLLIGYVQRFLVKSLIKKICIEVVHTHTQFYLHELKKLNLNPQYLPIFGNIPLIKKEGRSLYLQNNKISLINFGSIHPKAPVKQFAEEVLNYFDKKKETHPCIVFIGRSGNERENWIKEFESLGIEVVVMGELEADEISAVLQEASFGITTNPSFVIEKSGTVAAMREHGLPILIVSEDSKPKSDFNLVLANDLLQYKSGNFSELMNIKLPNTTEVKGINEIADKLLKSLSFKG
ncbi:hypothetical protein [Confluentibacter sediminis]|uniref:hypothetical protein n=1 Tax=Confluentibacter sediminis TaxID=2219045 RepID=UPI000DAE3A20|nr:hypothetical protein [Confluentibacter sediminis]